MRHHPAWHGVLQDAFDILAPYPLEQAEIEAILAAAAALGRIYRSAAKLLRRLPDTALVELGVPVHVLPAVRCSIPGVSDPFIGRLDLVRTNQGFKLLEFNADVPALIAEAFCVNAGICGEFGRRDPNASHEQWLAWSMRSAVAAGRRHVGKRARSGGKTLVAFSVAYPKDKALAEYLCRLLAPTAAECAPLESLVIGPDGLYKRDRELVDVLFRIYPLQLFRDGLFEGRRTDLASEMGGGLLRLVRERRLALINSPFAFLLESKALQALIWHLGASARYFDATERRQIRKYMLPTHLDPPDDGEPYVMKPAYGAEGDTVRIVSSSGAVLQSAGRTTQSEQLTVYQRYIQLPREEIMTEFGPRTLSLLTSCFLVSGKPVGVCMRAGEAITDASAWVLPVCIK